MKAPHLVRISQVDNGGFIVTVGCRDLVYMDLEQLIIDLRRYYDSPAEMVDEMAKKHGWDKEAEAVASPYRGESGGLRGRIPLPADGPSYP